MALRNIVTELSQHFAAETEALGRSTAPWRRVDAQLSKFLPQLYFDVRGPSLWMCAFVLCSELPLWQGEDSWGPIQLGSGYSWVLQEGGGSLSLRVCIGGS